MCGVFLLKIQFWIFLKYFHFFSGWHTQHLNLKMLSVWFSSLLSGKCTRMAINYDNIFRNKGCINSEKYNTKNTSFCWWYICSFWLKGGVGKISGSRGSEGVIWHAMATVPSIMGNFIFKCVLLRVTSVIFWHVLTFFILDVSPFTIEQCPMSIALSFVVNPDAHNDALFDCERT